MEVQRLNVQTVPLASEFRDDGISVAIATFNGERYLPDLLTSILNQSVLPFEVVFADDASSDKTIDAIYEFAKAAPFPVTLIRHKSNVGVIENFMSAFQYCSGDAVAYCDQDDVWLPDKIKTCAAALANSKVNLVIHASFVTDADLCKSGKTVNYNKHVGHNRFPVNSLEITGYGHQMVFRKSVIEALVILREKFAESLQGIVDNFDNAIPLAASLRGDIVVLANPLVLFRRHGGSVSPAAKAQVSRGISDVVARRFANNVKRTGQVTTFSQGLSQNPTALVHLVPDQNSYMEMLKNVSVIGGMRGELEVQPRFFVRAATLIRLWAFALTARPGGNLYAYKDLIADMVCAIVGGRNQAGTSGA